MSWLDVCLCGQNSPEENFGIFPQAQRIFHHSPPVVQLERGQAQEGEAVLFLAKRVGKKRIHLVLWKLLRFLLRRFQLLSSLRFSCSFLSLSLSCSLQAKTYIFSPQIYKRRPLSTVLNTHAHDRHTCTRTRTRTRSGSGNILPIFWQPF